MSSRDQFNLQNQQQFDLSAIHSFNNNNKRISTSGVNFIKILHAAFMRTDPKAQKDTDNLTEFLSFWDLCM